MQVIVYAVFFATFGSLIVMVKDRRKLVAVTLTGVMVTTLVGERPSRPGPIRHSQRNSGGPEGHQRHNPERIDLDKHRQGRSEVISSKLSSGRCS